MQSKSRQLVPARFKASKKRPVARPLKDVGLAKVVSREVAAPDRLGHLADLDAVADDEGSGVLLADGVDVLLVRMGSEGRDDEVGVELDLAVFVLGHDASIRDLLDLGGRELPHVVVAEAEHERVAVVEEGRRAELALHLDDGDVLPVHCELKDHVAARDAAAADDDILAVDLFGVDVGVAHFEDLVDARDVGGARARRRSP